MRKIREKRYSFFDALSEILEDIKYFREIGSLHSDNFIERNSLNMGLEGLEHHEDLELESIHLRKGV